MLSEHKSYLVKPNSPGAGYEFIAVGDTIKRADEFYDRDINDKWGWHYFGYVGEYEEKYKVILYNPDYVNKRFERKLMFGMCRRMIPTDVEIYALYNGYFYI